MGRLEVVVKVTILFLLWSGKSQGILQLIFCVNHESTTMQSDRSGGFPGLNPIAMSVVNCSRA